MYNFNWLVKKLAISSEYFLRLIKTSREMPKSTISKRILRFYFILQYLIAWMGVFSDNVQN